jgi:hypothetical protein
MTIKDHSLTRHVDLFTDATCATADGSRNEQGILRFMNATPDGGYALDYRFTMPGGWYEQYENVKLDASGFLWISNEIGGDAAENVQLTAQAPATPADQF